ncbi:RalA-binding protein 1, partial [Phenoliferia sp. Uapishka_3]
MGAQLGVEGENVVLSIFTGGWMCSSSHPTTTTPPHLLPPPHFIPMTDATSIPSAREPMTVASLLAEHSGDPSLALATLLARHNELIGQHASLRSEKDAAEKAAERSAMENQQLWRSFKGSGGSPRPPIAPRQNSNPSGNGSLGGAGTSAATVGNLPRRGNSGHELNPEPSGLVGAGGPSDSSSRSQDDSTLSPVSTSTRSETNTPPPVFAFSPNPHASVGSQSSLRKAASLDTGRRGSGGPAGEELSNDQFSSTGMRSFSEDKSYVSSKLPTSVSMPLIPSPDISAGGAPNANGYAARKYLPSIIPVSPLQVGSSHQTGSDSVASSPRGDRYSPNLASPTSPDPYQLQLPNSSDTRRARTPSNHSSSSLGSGSVASTSAVVDERTSGTGRLEPLTEAATSRTASPEEVRKLPPVLAPPKDYSAPQPPLSPTSPTHDFQRSPPAPEQRKLSITAGGTHSSSSQLESASPSHSRSLSSGLPAVPPTPTATRPTLYPAFFPFTRIRITSSNIKPKDKGKEIVSFLADVTVTVPPESDPDGLGGKASWRIEKPYSDFVALDAAVRGKKVNKSELKSLGSLPDKTFFKDHAPYKSDQRKTILERYLQTLLLAPLRDRTAVCAFFNSDVTEEPTALPGSAGGIEGWLTKRGRNFGGWQTRYYVLANGSLSYYETRDGQKLGEIPLTNAAIGRQSSRAADTGDDSYLHAFLVRTTTRGSGGDKDQEADHILCAESDEARDAWVTALTSLQAQPPNVGRASTSASFDREREPSSKPSALHLHTRQRSAGSTSGPSGPPQPDAAPTPHNTGRKGSTELPSSVSLPIGLDMMSGESSKRTTSAQGQNSEPRPTQLQLPSAGGRGAPSGSNGSTSANGSSKSSSHHQDRPVSPDSRRGDAHKIVTSQVSGPMNAAPMPSGYDFKKAERIKKTKSSFWNFSRSNGPDKPLGPTLPTIAQRPVFGVPLKEAVAVSRIRPGLELPAVVYRCVEYLEAKNAESEEGIFRLSGSTNVIRVLKDRFNAEGDVQLLNSNEYYDPHAVAGLLKAYLRELPVHILTRELHPEFLKVIELQDRKDRVNALGKLVARLPIEEYTLFRFLLALSLVTDCDEKLTMPVLSALPFLLPDLCSIAQNAEVSKMNLRNLGIVFSPTLAIPPPLFSLLLSEFDLVFAVDGSTGLSRPIMVDGGSSLPADDAPCDEDTLDPRRKKRASNEDHAPNNRNSQLYEATGAAQLMERESSRAKLRVQEGESEIDADQFNEAHEDAAEDSNYLAPPSAQSQSSGSPPSTDNSPDTPSFGLPASPRPGASFNIRS